LFGVIIRYYKDSRDDNYGLRSCVSGYLGLNL
jgi:hypothetical protein